MTTSGKIKELLDADQNDRESPRFGGLNERKRWAIIKKGDVARIKKAELILKSKPKLKGVDCFRIAIVFQHGGSAKYIRKAKILAEKGMKMGYKPSKWLYAAATDRLLIMEGRKQKFGTQYGKNKNGKWQFLPVDQTTTDATRTKFNVLSLQEAKSMVKTMTKDDLLRSKRIGLTRRK